MASLVGSRVERKEDKKLLTGRGKYTADVTFAHQTYAYFVRSPHARAQIKNSDLEILPGSLLDIELLYDQKEALSVTDTSIIFEDEKKFVYKILDNNKIKKTEVVTGIRKDGNLEVLKGLNPNERVVKEGLARLADGMTVRPLTK